MNRQIEQELDHDIRTGNVEGVGIAIGHGASVRIYGDVYYHPIKLRAALRRQFDPLLKDYNKLFAGREKDLDFIAQRILEPTGGYLVITAPPGFGKTALMAALIQGTPEAFAYHFFNPAYVPGSVEEVSFLRNVVEQMAQWRGHYKEEVPEHLDQLTALFNQMMGEELEGTRILVLDGIDEVAAWSIRNYLLHPLPPGFHLIITLRDVGQDWMDVYGFSPEETAHLPLDGLSHQEVVQVLQTAGGLAATITGDESLLAEVIRVAAYPARQSLGADPFYVRILAEDLASGQLKSFEIGQQPRGLNRYLDGWWKAIKVMAGDQPAKDLFGTLAAAQGPIFRTDMEAINTSLVDDWEVDFFDEVISRVRRFVAGDDQVGYTLAHPRLQRYLRWRLRVDRYAEKLVDYCARWPEHRSPYALAFYANHLVESSQKEALFDLIAPSWMAAKYDAFRSHRSFAEDLTLIAGQAATEARSDYLLPLVRACLVYNELVTDAPPEILGVLAQIGQGKRAMDYAALMSDAGEQAEAYRLIGLALRDQGQMEMAQKAFLAAFKAAQANPSKSRARKQQAALVSDLRSAGLEVPLFARSLPDDEADQAEAELSTSMPAGLPIDLSSALKLLDRKGQAKITDQVIRLIDEMQSPDQAFDLILSHLKTSFNWLYSSGESQRLSDVAEMLVLAGLEDRILNIADMATNRAARAWTIAQLAVGLARADDSSGAVDAATEAWHLIENGSIDQSDDLAGASSGEPWLATPTMTAIAQALALAGEDEKAAKAANQVLTSTRAVGFETEKTRMLTTTAWALFKVKRFDQAGESALMTLSTAKTILNEEDQATTYDNLVQLLIALEQREMAARAARKLLPLISFLDDQQRMATLAYSAQALAATIPSETVAQEICFYAKWDYDMEGEEIARLIGPVAVRLAESDEAELAVALATQMVTLWPNGEPLSEVAVALACRDYKLQAEALVQNVIIQASDCGLFTEEEGDFILYGLAEGLAQSGQTGLARQAAEAIIWPEERAQALAIVDESDQRSEGQTAEDEPPRENDDIQSADEPPLQPVDPVTLITQLGERLLVDGMPDRVQIYETLEASAYDLAAIDKGQTLGQVVEAIRAVDLWWGRTQDV